MDSAKTKRAYSIVGGDRMKFSDKFKDFCAELDKQVSSTKPKEVVKEDPPKPIITYKINKRSLPPALDKTVALGLSLDEADHLVNSKFKTKSLDDGTWIYYDILLDGDNSSVYHNPGPVVKEEPNETVL